MKKAQTQTHKVVYVLPPDVLNTIGRAKSWNETAKGDKNKFDEGMRTSFKHEFHLIENTVLHIDELTK
jgi:hypothetical protein